MSDEKELARCTQCGRKTWSRADVDGWCAMTQPSTHCVVPLEATDKMAQAAWDIQTSFNPQAIKAMYKAMIKARPK